MRSSVDRLQSDPSSPHLSDAEDSTRLSITLPTRTYTCGDCGESTTSSRRHLHHLVEVHKHTFGIYECDLCDYATRYKQKLPRHRKCHFAGRSAAAAAAASAASAASAKGLSDAASVGMATDVDKEDRNNNTSTPEVEEDKQEVASQSNSSEDYARFNFNRYNSLFAVPQAMNVARRDEIIPLRSTEEKVKRTAPVREAVDPNKYIKIEEIDGVKFACSRCGNVYKWKKSLNKHWKEKHDTEGHAVHNPVLRFSRYHQTSVPTFSAITAPVLPPRYPVPFGVAVPLSQPETSSSVSSPICTTTAVMPSWPPVTSPSSHTAVAIPNVRESEILSTRRTFKPPPPAHTNSYPLITTPESGGDAPLDLSCATFEASFPRHNGFVSSSSPPLLQNGRCADNKNVIEYLSMRMSDGPCNDVRHDCSHCTTTCTSALEWRIHMLREHGENGNSVTTDARPPYKPNTSDYRARWPAELAQHTATVLLEKPYCCPTCSFRSRSKWDRDSHARCCTAATVDRLDVVRNDIAKTENGSVGSDECVFSGNTSSKFLYHVDRTAHDDDGDGEKHYFCGTCGYETRWKSDLRKHARTYQHRLGDEQNELRCSHCPYSTTRAHKLESHVRIHASRVDHSSRMRCKICGHVALDIRELLQHKQTHSSGPNSTVTASAPAHLHGNGRQCPRRKRKGHARRVHRPTRFLERTGIADAYRQKLVRLAIRRLHSGSRIGARGFPYFRYAKSPKLARLKASSLAIKV